MNTGICSMVSEPSVAEKFWACVQNSSKNFGHSTHRSFMMKTNEEFLFRFDMPDGSRKFPHCILSLVDIPTSVLSAFDWRHWGRNPTVQPNLTRQYRGIFKPRILVLKTVISDHSNQVTIPIGFVNESDVSRMRQCNEVSAAEINRSISAWTWDSRMKFLSQGFTSWPQQTCRNFVIWKLFKYGVGPSLYLTAIICSNASLYSVVQ
jgi:hypothetical protein